MADYVVAALLELEAAGHLTLRGARFGVVGFGHAGRRVAHAAGALGMRPVINDPPRAGATGEPLYRPLDELLDCEVIGLHCALEDEGPYPSRHLVNRALLERVRPGTCLINVARGPVVDSVTLRDALHAGRIRAAVLDVWEHEPSPDPQLVEAAFIATPHIAGYAYDSKINATAQVYEAACRFLDVPPTWSLASARFPAGEPPRISLDGAHATPVHGVVRAAYDILEESTACRAALQREGEARALAFEALRRDYPVRRTFSAFTVEAGSAAAEAAATLDKLGFQIAASPVMEDAVDAP